MSNLVAPKSWCNRINEEVEAWVKNYFGQQMQYDSSLEKTIDQWGFPWFRAGALIVNSEQKILLIHEGRVQVRKIRDEDIRNEYLYNGYDGSDWVDGDGGWNFPSGRLRRGESFEEAILRKAREESGWEIALASPLHVRKSDKAGNPYVMPVYLAGTTSGPEKYSTPKTRETLEISWFTPRQIHELGRDRALRSPEFVLNALKAYEDAQRE